MSSQLVSVGKNQINKHLQYTQIKPKISTYAGVTQRLECLPSNYLKAIQHLLIVVKKNQDTIQKNLMV